MKKSLFDHFLLTWCIAVVLLMASGPLHAGESPATLISEVQVVLNESADGQNSTLVQVHLNSERLPSWSAIHYAALEDSGGDSYLFTADEFVQGGDGNTLVKTLPFLLPDADITITVTDMDTNTHLFSFSGNPETATGIRSGHQKALSYDGSWTGSDSRYDVAFTVSNNTMTRFDITFDMSCTGGSPWYTVSFSDWNTRSVSGGSFQISSGVNTFAGTFNSTSSCSGTWANTIYCDAQGSWEAANQSAPDDPEPEPEPTAHSDIVYIPHITGETAQWEDYLQVDNFGINTAEFVITLYSGEGTEICSETHTVGMLEKSFITLKDLNSAASSAECGTIAYSDPKLTFRLTQEIQSGGIAEFSLSDRLAASVACLFTDTAQQFACLAKGLALTNFGPSDATVILSAIGTGTILGSATVTIKPNARLLGVHTTWFPGIDIGDIRAILATTDDPVLSGIAISGNAGNSQLLFTSAVDLD